MEMLLVHELLSLEVKNAFIIINIKDAKSLCNTPIAMTYTNDFEFVG
jgi:hypothetical protein